MSTTNILRFGALAPLAALGVLIAASVPVACSNQPAFGSSNRGATRNNPELEDECGTECARTSDCADGLFCLPGSVSSGTCQADCVAGEKSSDDCGGDACQEDGQCEGATDRSVEGRSTLNLENNGGAGGGTGNENKECIDLVVDFDPIIPNVVLLVDQSGSMTAANGFGDKVDDAISDGTYEAWNCGNPRTRWNVVRNILLNPDSGVVKPLEEQVRFGLSLYSSEGGGGGGKTCPILTDVDVSFGSHQDMLDTFDCSDLKTDTPTRESLSATADALAAQMLDGENVVVLATDGAPDNCLCYNWDTNIDPSCNSAGESAEQAAVVAEAKRIQDDLGITVHVIDVSTPGNTTLRSHLEDVAAAGGGDIFDGTDPGGLSNAFQTIIDGVRSCAIDLDGSISPGKESTGTVTLNGEKLTLDGENGWKVNTPTQIELLGTSCETIKSGSQNLDISFPCGSFVPPDVK